MNQKQLSILIALVVVIGGLGLWLHKHKSASWKAAETETGQKLLGEFPLNDVAQVVIKQSNAVLNLVKDESQWRVRERHNYPANFNELSQFLRKVWELKGVQRVKVGPSILPRLELLPPDQGTNSGTLVEFKDKDGKTLRTLLLGKKHMRQGGAPSPFGDDSGWPDGRFVLVENNQATPNVWVISDPLSNVEAKPETWLNKELAKVEKIRSIQVTHPQATNNWKLTRETESGEWKLADAQPGETVDTTKTSSYNWLLSSASFNDVLAPDTKPESVGLDKPIQATLETFDHFTYTLKLGSATTNDNYHVQMAVDAQLPAERTPGQDEKPEDKEKLDKEFKEKLTKQQEKLKQEQALQPWTFLLSKWTVESLLRPRHELLKVEEKKAETTDTNHLNHVIAPPSILQPPPMPPVVTPPPAVTNAPAAPVAPTSPNAPAAAVTNAVALTNAPAAAVVPAPAAANPVPETPNPAPAPAVSPATNAAPDAPAAPTNPPPPENK